MDRNSRIKEFVGSITIHSCACEFDPVLRLYNVIECERFMIGDRKLQKEIYGDMLNELVAQYREKVKRVAKVFFEELSRLRVRISPADTNDDDWGVGQKPLREVGKKN